MLKESGLLSWKPEGGDKAPMYSRFRNRIMFPISSEAGKVIAFTGRTLHSDEKAGPKYLNSPETPIYSKSKVLFNLDRARENIRKLDYSILVEGQMDCISVFAAGFRNVIASSGTAFTESQARLLARYSKNVLVNFDPDTAGAAAAERSLGLLVAEDFRTKVLTLETGYDPDLFIRKRGKAAYETALKSAPDYFAYLLDRARAQFRVQTAEGKRYAVDFLLPHLQRVHNDIQRDELAADMAQKLGIESALLRRDLKRAVNARAASLKAPAEPHVSDAEKIVVRVLASRDDRELSVRIGNVLSAEALHQGLVAESLINALLASPNTEDVVEINLNEGDRRLLASVLMTETQEDASPQLADDAIQALRRRHLEGQQRALQARIAEAERKQDSATLARLLQEKLALDRTLSHQRF